MNDISPEARHSTERFYDQFTQKLLANYARGNLRMECALRFAVRQLRARGMRQTLDIGCGIGWSSNEFIRSLPEMRVRGVDLSSNSIAMAQILFANPRLSFERADVTLADWTRAFAGRFDSCVMLDTFEHIPQENRTAFASALSALLAPDAVLLLTCPSLAHQAYLREHQPSGLQPVDEDVTVEDLLGLAAQLGGSLCHYEGKSIWRPGDYFHAVIVRGRAGVQPGCPALMEDPVRLEPRRERARRLQKLEGRLSAEDLAALRRTHRSGLKARIRRGGQWLSKAWHRLRHRRGVPYASSS
jgi:SAM-dependent methyltransferase